MHRIQAPEDAATRPSPPPPPATPADAAATAALRRAATATGDDLESQQPIQAPARAPTAPVTPQRNILQEIVAVVSNPESKSCTYYCVT